MCEKKDILTFNRIPQKIDSNWKTICKILQSKFEYSMNGNDTKVFCIRGMYGTMKKQAKDMIAWNDCHRQN